MQAARPLFARHGYRGASLASIAEAAALTQPGLLHHFHSKEELLFALLEERNHEDGQRIKSATAEHGADVLAALEGLVAHNSTTRELVQLFVVLVAEATSADHPAHEYFVERYEQVRSRMLRTLRAGQATGEVRADVDLDALVPVIVAVMDGLQIQWVLDPTIDMLAGFQLFAGLVRSTLMVPPS